MSSSEMNQLPATTGQHNMASCFDQAPGLSHRDHILRHMVEQYLTGNSLPRGTPNRFTVAEFHRLFRYVVQEGYGE